MLHLCSTMALIKAKIATVKLPRRLLCTQLTLQDRTRTTKTRPQSHNSDLRTKEQFNPTHDSTAQHHKKFSPIHDGIAQPQTQQDSSVNGRSPPQPHHDNTPTQPLPRKHSILAKHNIVSHLSTIHDSNYLEVVVMSYNINITKSYQIQHLAIRIPQLYLTISNWEKSQNKYRNDY